MILLMADDQRWDSFGCYGREEFKTQHIDQLAKEGVTFDAAYYAVSICMPSRVTMMTGQYLSRHQCGFTYPYNYTVSKEEFSNSYPALLKKAGYRTGFIGKFGFAVTQKRQQGNRIKGYNFYKNLGEVFDYFAGDGVHFDKGRVALWPRADEVLRRIHRKDRPANQRVLRTGDAILHFLETQPADQPFCLSVSFFGVKNDGPKTIYPGHYRIFADTEMSVPDNWVEGANPKLPKVVRENWRGVPLHKRFHADQLGYQRLVRNFAAQGYSVDQQVGRMVAKLKSQGLLNDTVIIYTSDNGRFHGCHGLHDKALLYEESVKAPLVIFDGRLPASKRGRRESALVSSVDIAPTITSIAGLSEQPSMQGRDFSKLINNSQEKDQWRDMVYFENLFLNNLYGAWQNRSIDARQKNNSLILSNKSYRCRGIRTSRWKYFIYYEHNPVIEELYDLKNDPSEQENLADFPDYQRILISLRNSCNQFYIDEVK
ncbi:MAG: sulfatase-like hydrolase/transferase [Planctomycetota bacterium]